MMIRKNTLLGCVLVTTLGLIPACSDDQGVDAPPPKTGAGSGGSQTGGSSGSGGSTGGTTGSGGATGGTGGATGGTGGTATGGAAGAGGTTGGAAGKSGAGGAAGTGGATGGTGGTGTGGAAGTGGSGVDGGKADGSAGNAGSAGTGGTGVDGGKADTGTGGTGGGPTTDAGSGACGPLRGADPTEATVQAKGSFTVMSYTNAPDSPGYGASTVYYPSDATPPFVGVAAVPGLNGMQSSVNEWGTFLASHGYVVITIDTNSTGDNPSQRGTALMAAVTTLKAENTRAASALNGKMSDCMVVMGHSMGGGGSLIAANSNSPALKGVIGLSPYGGGSSSANITVPTLLFVATGDFLSVPGTHVKPAYNGMPAATTKLYLEFSGGDHNIAQYPLGLQMMRPTNAIVARYGLAWLKFNVDGDTRYRQFLDRVTSTSIADYQTNLP